MSDLTVLQKSALFREWPEADLKKLAELCNTKHLGPGEILFNEGESSEAFYFLCSGTMGIKKHSKGDEEVVSSFGSASHFGELAMLDKSGEAQKRSATAQAIESSIVIEIPYAPFLEILKGSPQAGFAFYKNVAFDLANRIRKTTNDLAGIRALRLRHT